MNSRKSEETNVSLGKEIALLRKRAGKTQANMAEYLGITPQQVSNYETGKCGMKVSRVEEIRAYLRRFFASGFAEDQLGYSASNAARFELARQLRTIRTDIKSIAQR